MGIHKFIIAATALLSINARAESSSLPSTNGLVPNTYKVTESIHGDLNKDGQEDIVLLVKATNKAKEVIDDHGQRVDRNRRGIIIAFKRGNSYELALKNLNCFSSENEDGGVYFPPELSISTKKGNLLIDYSHGRYGYWTYNFRFQNGDFELIGYDSSHNHGPVVESFTSINLLSNRVIKRVNTNEEAQGGDERFKETLANIKKPKAIKLSGIINFDELSVEKELGLSN